MERTDKPEAINPGKQLIEAFLGVAATAKSARLSYEQIVPVFDVFDTAISKNAITEENYKFLDTSQLVGLAIDGVKAGLSVQKARVARETAQETVRDLHKLLSRLRGNHVTVTALGSNDPIEYRLFNEQHIGYETLETTSPLTGFIPGLKDWRGLELFIDPDQESMPAEAYRTGCYRVPVIDSETMEPLITIEIGDISSRL